MNDLHYSQDVNEMIEGAHGLAEQKAVRVYLPNPFYINKNTYDYVTWVSSTFNVRPASIMELVVDFAIASLRPGTTDSAVSFPDELSNLLTSGETDRSRQNDASIIDFFTGVKNRLMSPLSMAVHNRKGQFLFSSIMDFNYLIMQEEYFEVTLEFLEY